MVLEACQWIPLNVCRNAYHNELGLVIGRPLAEAGKLVWLLPKNDYIYHMF